MYIKKLYYMHGMTHMRKTFLMSPIKWAIFSIYIYNLLNVYVTFHKFFKYSKYEELTTIYKYFLNITSLRYIIYTF